MKPWAPAEEGYLRDNYAKLSLDEICRHLGRTKPSVSNRAGLLGLRKPKDPKWTPEEIQYLRDNWGKKAPETIARKLGRSAGGIDIKAKRLKLGPVYDLGCFTKSDLVRLLGADHKKIGRWIKQGLLKATIAPTTTRKTRQNIAQVKPQDLLKFLREHPEQWDGRKTGDIMRAIREKEHLADKIRIQRKEGKRTRRIPEHLKPAFIKLVADVATNASERIREARRQSGLLEDWLEKKRKRDHERKYPREHLRWTEEEDDNLRALFKRGLSYQEISEALGRSKASVGLRISRIVIWERRCV